MYIHVCTAGLIFAIISVQVIVLFRIVYSLLLRIIPNL